MTMMGPGDNRLRRLDAGADGCSGGFQEFVLQHTDCKKEKDILALRTCIIALEECFLSLYYLNVLT